MRIGICDDEAIIRESLAGIIEECTQKLGMEAEVLTFITGMELLAAIDDIDVVFLDLNMPDLDGIQTGKCIVQRNKKTKIIIASSMTERFKETYTIQAFRFITKPFEVEEVAEALQSVLRGQVGWEKIDVYKKRIVHHISQRDIQYIRSINSGSELAVENQFFRKETSINEMEKFLDDRLFFRVHRSYLVNMLWIQKTSESSVTILGREIPISRRNRKSFIQAYIDFDLGGIREW